MPDNEKLQMLKRKITELDQSLALWDSGSRLENKVSGIVHSFEEYMESRIAEIELEIAVLEKVAIKLVEEG